MDNNTDQWFCWIPFLTNKEPHVLMDHPIPESEGNFKFIGYQENPEQFSAEFNDKGISRKAQIAIREGFLVVSFEETGPDWDNAFPIPNAIL